MNVDKFFGVRVDIGSRLKKNQFSSVEQAVRQFIQQNPQFQDSTAYMMRLLFRVNDKHWSTSGVEKRLDTLKVEVSVPQKLRRTEGMQLLNHALKLVYTKGVQKSRFGKFRNSYVLKGSFLSVNDVFEEHVLILVEDSLLKNQPRLAVNLVASATASYAPRFLNADPSSITTTLWFELTDDVRLV